MAPNPAMVMHHNEAEWACATWHNVFFIVWRGAPTAQRAKLLAVTMRAFGAAHPEGFGVFLVLNPDAPTPDTDARQFFAKAMQSEGAKLRGVCYLVPSAGFKGAAVRGAITGLSLIARESYPTRVFDELPEASQWLASRLSSGVDALAIARRIAEVRHEIEAKKP